MIKKLLQRVFKSPKKPASTTPVHSQANIERIPAAVHRIDRRLISNAAIKTTDALQKAGFEAFIVGGAVRDLLLKKRPKDFDVATDATPEQVHRIFRRSRIIGRRFRLVHVMFGDETIEVSTFRGSHLAEAGDAKVTDSGRILRDNVFGSQEEDAARRDFTANALYYDPSTEEVLDFHRGVADLQAGVLRMIGDPVTRYREDPVRMLRAVRLSAKLGLKLAPETERPILELAELLHDVPPSRLFDEMLKLFLSGHAIESANALRQHGLHHGLLPLLDVVLEQPMGERFVRLALKNTDERVLADKPVSPGFLFAALLWHEVLLAWKKFEQQGNKPIPALHMAMDEVCDIQAEKMAIHKRYSVTMREIWSLQPRFEQRAGRRPYSLLENPRYRAGYDFLLLRCESGELPNEIGQWWTDFANADGEQRQAMLLPDTAPRKRRRRRSRKPSSSAAEE
ncbi:polynucleotide adenylyltransferase PcnB [Methylobacillus flagellatus]|uniref:Poly(A) polymerase I n=1 Tax=Methylobacillus flagellatus (strain ATCC 51484 / DSM 6875 / VKM B-1610 / KT) TaxID=265072 RepID=Q1H3R7_METFK|nr:polynucleotide adenylyltransferase PcnB [Methylobacillus flagellatus]ABE48870.1 poly(A) polymerase [Methylobacillus flagellatus KT]